jgi:hypothetical protein
MVNSTQTAAQFVAEYEALQLAALDDRIKTVTANCDAVEKLRAAGFSAGMHNRKWGDAQYVFVYVGQSQLPDLRRLLGRLRLVERTAVSETELHVVVSPVAYPGVRFYYTQTFRPGGKCRIETQVTTNHSLVCCSR